MDAALTSDDRVPDAEDAIVREPLPTRGELDFRMIELLFFAYREFTTDADSILMRYGFGRAHHRVLHFVNRDPGMTIAELLDLLQITKQSLSRVLRQLIDGGFVRQMPGVEDRRQRCLFPTERGRELTLELSRAQARRIEVALGNTSPGDAGPIGAFLMEMADDRPTTREWFRKKGIDRKEPL
ncbi:MarR family winged helix-turn-helix transcriptional regulator [Aurantimonas coralicida]|jgi:DNA-binding MarR family transcriptional regulator|uniref:MarR family winged helix-turn-helix transcriptional regulator n=1 Tax=Aurantimonas coralicida TaxID=182270 RepID=UPI001D19400A|nr:MarR family transcriptional regulator [Aurantimonas coralicida]MCC4297610.1 MarR family transcriptional regulator [Aurantimonas coralicida]MCW7542301.1 MarR family transcriptional regulator [Aurantimonas litoralis]MDE0923902.1 MarR family transcriptional regulator [Aurantimonas coralicida]